MGAGEEGKESRWRKRERLCAYVHICIYQIKQTYFNKLIREG